MLPVLEFEPEVSCCIFYHDKYFDCAKFRLLVILIKIKDLRQGGLASYVIKMNLLLVIIKLMCEHKAYSSLDIMGILTVVNAPAIVV